MRPKTKPVADALGALLKKSYQNMNIGGERGKGERKDFVERKELKGKGLGRKSGKKMFLSTTNGKETE